MSTSDAPDLRLIVITDRESVGDRDLVDVVETCLAAGAPAVQLRDKRATAHELYDQACVLRRCTRRHGALLFVNDRIDVALAAGADGAHLGPDDPPLLSARRLVPRHFLLGYSADDPGTARSAEADGADYIGCGAVFGTSSKAEAAGERIGTKRLAAVAAAVRIPVVGIGGIGPGNAMAVAKAGAAGAAAIGSVMSAEDPAAAVREILAAFPAGRHG